LGDNGQIASIEGLWQYDRSACPDMLAAFLAAPALKALNERARQRC
jgi:hypothetical protein